MAPLQDLLAVYGAIDQSVVAADDPQWSALVERYLPGTTGPGRQGWYAEIQGLIRRLSPDGAEVEFPGFTDAISSLTDTVRQVSPVAALDLGGSSSSDDQPEPTAAEFAGDWTLGGDEAPVFTPANRAQLFYAGAVLKALLPVAPPAAAIALNGVLPDALDTFLGFAGDPTAEELSGFDKSAITTEVTRRIDRTQQLNSLLSAHVFSGNTSWPTLLRDGSDAIRADVMAVPLIFAADSMSVTVDGQAASTASAAVAEIDGNFCAVLRTDTTRAGVTVGAIKAIVDPRNWDQLSRFFVKMPPLTADARGASQVLEHVSTLPDKFVLKTALKYWKEDFGAAAQPADVAGIINYELSDQRAGTGDSGLVLVDNGYLHIEPAQSPDGTPAVRVRTSKMVAIQGCSVTATAMLINVLGWSTMGNAMLFDSAKRAPKNYQRPLVGWSTSPEGVANAAPAAGNANAPDPAKQAPQLPAGALGGLIGELAGMWAEAVTQSANSASKLAVKWSKNELTVADLITESSQLGAFFASQPWRYLAEAQQRLSVPPATGPSDDNPGGKTP